MNSSMFSWSTKCPLSPGGVISLSRILRSPRPTLMREICDDTQVMVPADMVQEEVALLFEKYDLTTAGVVDAPMDCLIGMITVDDVMEVATGGI